MLVLTLLEEGAITLTTVTLLAAHLTADNLTDTLEAARWHPPHRILQDRRKPPRLCALRNRHTIIHSHHRS